MRRSVGKSPERSANWITGDLAYALKNSGKDIESCPLPPGRLAALIRMIDSGEISGKIAKTVFEEIYALAGRAGRGRPPPRAGSDQRRSRAGGDHRPGHRSQIQSSWPNIARGKEKLFGYFVGQVMKETKGQANPQLLNDLLKRKLRE